MFLNSFFKAMNWKKLELDMDTYFLKDDCFLLLGNPVNHSLSPLIHNAAFKYARIPRTYDTLKCQASDLETIMKRLTDLNLGGNVTLPHKELAARIVDCPSEAVAVTGACNTFWTRNGKIQGDNTDVEGFRRACEIFLGAPPTGLKVLVLGAGGVVRAVLWSLLKSGVSEIVLLNRTVARARALADHFDDARISVAVSREDIRDCHFDLLVNGTSLGLSGEDVIPFELDLVARTVGVMDLVYGRTETKLVSRAKGIGMSAVDGREMLLQQAAASFELWWSEPAPVDTMRRTMKNVFSE